MFWSTLWLQWLVCYSGSPSGDHPTALSRALTSAVCTISLLLNTQNAMSPCTIMTVPSQNDHFPTVNSQSEDKQVDTVTQTTLSVAYTC